MGVTSIRLQDDLDKSLADIPRLTTLSHLGRKTQRAPNPDVVSDLSTGAYIVRYLILEDEAHVLRIWHKREDRASL